MNELALFAGAGGGILGGQLLGWRTICAVERDAYAAAVLAQRQNNGLLDLFPIWSDITTFDGRPWHGIVDVVSGGFPCQDISVAGKGAGIDGERSGLWGEMERIISEVRPRFVFVENSPTLTLRGLGRVLGDLAEMGYDAEWGVLAASDVGAPHKRERIWVVGHTKSERTRNVSEDDRPAGGKIDTFDHSSCVGRGIDRQENRKDVSNSTRLHDGCGDSRKGEGQIQQSGVCTCKGDVSDTDLQHVYYSGLRAGKISQQQASGVQKLLLVGRRETRWPIEPDVGRVANGVAFRVDRLKALGNGQVPRCHAEAWRRLLKRIQ